MLAVRRRPRGFTLVELLVVVGIIAVLIALLLPALSAARAHALQVTCMSRIRQLCIVSTLYVNEFNGYLPVVANGGGTDGSFGRPCLFPNGGTSASAVDNFILARYLPSSADNLKLYTCPLQETNAGYSATGNFSYRYNGLLGGFDSSTWIPLASDPSNVIFVPWRVSRIRESSKMALFIESTLQSNGTLSDNNMDFQQDTTAKYQAIKQVDNPGRSVHYARNIGIYGANYTSWAGVENVGFVDGSVRGVNVKLNSSPFSSWPDVYITPYYQQMSW